MEQGLGQAEAVVSNPAWRLIGPPLLGVVVFLAGLAAQRIVIGRLRRLAAKTRWTWDDLTVEVLKGPLLVGCLIAALYVTVLAYPASASVEIWAARILSILWLISATLAFLKLSDQLIQRYGRKLSAALPLTSLTQNLTRGVILVLGALMVLNSLGVSITPLLTALGVGGLAVALALQETLSNLFAGVYITLSRQVRVGDYIKLDSGEEGYVVDIAWRSTRIRTLPNNWIVIPNTKLAQTIVTNYDLPSQDLAVLVEMGVDYRSDLEQVERITGEVGREVMKSVPGGVPEFEPFIRVHTFGESSIKFTVILRAKSFVDQYLIKHEFLKRLHRRYAQEGIPIPFPTYTVFLQPSAAKQPP